MATPPKLPIEDARVVPDHLRQTAILVVDDIEDNRDLMVELLAEEGYEDVVTVESGARALEVLSEHGRIGLVLLDLMMPGMDGYEVCQRISGDPATSHIPVIVVTGAAVRRDEALTRSFACGAMDYIPKPINEVELYGRVKSALMLFHERLQVRIKTAELEESHMRYDLAVNGVNDGIWDIDLANSAIFYSDKWREILGYRHDEVPNLMGVWEDLVHPDDRERVLKTIHDHWEAKSPFYTSEHRLRHKDGHYIWVFSRGRAVWDETGRVVRMAGSTTDITPRRNLEERLRQSQQMQSVGRLAAGVAHDFNNLLTAIIGHVEISRKHMGDNKEGLASLDQIRIASVQAGDLCKQLLAYSGQGQYSLDRIQLNQVCTETLDLLKVTINRCIELHLKLCSGRSTILADASQIRQVFLNLLVNASEAIGEKNSGAITVTTERVTAEQVTEQARMVQDWKAPSGQYVLVRVQDTGCGIRPEDLRKIFDPFFTTKFTGRGLGLSAVIGIVKANKGYIDVRSELGKGTTFSVYFPLAPETGEKEELEDETIATEDRGRWKGWGTILVVEDEPVIREVSEFFLKELGFEVLLAKDGREGVDLFKEHQDRITVVMMDLNMPNMHGEQAFEAIRAIRADVPVLVVSGYSEQEVVRRFSRAKAAEFLRKPFMGAQLAAKLKTCLEASSPE